jgi:hypothetical protein
MRAEARERPMRAEMFAPDQAVQISTATAAGASCPAGAMLQGFRSTPTCAQASCIMRGVGVGSTPLGRSASERR